MSAADVLATLKARGETLAVAESLTGGLLAATIVDMPGASAVFRGGLVVYATDLKGSLAGVPAELLAARGPVDPDVALALARVRASGAGPTGAWPRRASPAPSRRTGIRWGGCTWPCAGPAGRLCASSRWPATGPRSGREAWPRRWRCSQKP